MAHRVLVCDDSMFMRQKIKQVLEDAGYEIVAEAGTGAEAIVKYEEVSPDLVTMDVVMPEKSGLDAVLGIMQDHPDARIVMCSALGQKKLVTDALHAGAKDFVVKPFQDSQLLDAMERAIQ